MFDILLIYYPWFDMATVQRPLVVDMRHTEDSSKGALGPAKKMLKIAPVYGLRVRAHSTHALFWDFLTPSPPCTLNRVSSMTRPPSPHPCVRTMYIAPKGF